MNNITTLLFDLGGVLIELGDLAYVIPSESDSRSAMERWRNSNAVYEHEIGKISAQSFAAQIVDELALSIEPNEFLSRFEKWPIGMYPGSFELLEQLSHRFRLACLSNTNECHYSGFIVHQAEMALFEKKFLSFEMGLLKPHSSIYEATLAGLDSRPESILFFDDSATNVAAARSSGMHSEQVNAPNGVIRALKSMSLFP